MLLKDIKKCNISIYDCPKLTNELYIEDSKMMLIKLLETQIFDKFWPSKVKLSSNEPELLKPKLELLEQKSSLLHVWTRQFEIPTKSELDLALVKILIYLDIFKLFYTFSPIRIFFKMFFENNEVKIEGNPSKFLVWNHFYCMNSTCKQ